MVVTPELKEFYTRKISQAIGNDATAIVEAISRLVQEASAGISNFTELDDTPGGYAGDELKYVRVNTLGTALEFATVTGGGTVDISGTPVANDFARFTDADTLEGRSYTEVKSDLSLNLVENTAHSTDGHTMTIDGRDVSTDGTKLDLIEDNADVTDAVNIASSIVGVAGKTTPADADTLALIDSVAANALKELTWANLKATLKTYNDTLYADGDVTAAANLTATAIVIGDDGAKGVKASLATIDASGNVSIGAARLKTTNLVIKEIDVNTIAIRNADDSSYKSLISDTLRVGTVFSYHGSSGSFGTRSVNDAYVNFKALITDGALAEVARIQGAADPYFQATLPLRFSPIATASLPATPVEGMFTYDGTLDKMVYYNGAAWVTTEGAGGGDMLAATYDPASKGDQVLTISDLENPPTEDLATKVVTSEYIFDHNARNATAAVQGHATAAQITKLDAITALADVTADNAPKAHQASHSPNDGGDALDCAAAAEISVVVAASEGTADTLARSDHVHAIAHAITDNHLVTVDGSPNAAEVTVWTANGLDGKTYAELLALLYTAAVPEQLAIKYPAALSADGKFFATDSMTGTAGEQIDFGEAVYFKAGDSKWWLAKGDAAATVAPMTGLVIVAGAAEASVTIMLQGIIRADAAFPALTVGAAAFISAATSGQLTTTNLTTGQFQKAVGWVKTTNVVVVTANPDWNEVD